MKRTWIAAVGLVVGVANVPLAGPLQLDRGVLSAGGGSAGTSRFSVTGSLGQPVANSDVATTPGALAGRSGFWSQLTRWLNVAPTPLADTVERRAGQGAHVLAAQLLGNDLDGDWDALQLVSVDAVSAGGGAVLRDGPWIIYLPPGSGDPSADDAFGYQVTDGYGAPVVGTVLIRAAGAAGTTANPLQISSLPGEPAQVEVRFQGIAGRSYRIETATAVNGPWTAAGTIVANASGGLLFTELVGAQPHFFRILEP